LDTVAMLGFDDAQVAVDVTSWLAPSDRRAIAVS
jgi:hypothetical protein